MITAAQLRAARGLVDWTRNELAKAANISPETVKNIEHGIFRPQEDTARRIVQTFATEGVEFVENEGVRFRKDSMLRFEGPDRFDDFYDFLYEHMREYGGEACLSVVDESLMSKYRKNPEAVRDRMRELVKSGRVTYRVLVTEGDFSGDYAEYRIQPPQANVIAPTAFYAFGECLALITFPEKLSPQVIVIISKPLTLSYRRLSTPHGKSPGR